MTQLVTIFKGTVGERPVTAVVPQGWSGMIDVMIPVTNGKPGWVQVVKTGAHDKVLPMEAQPKP